MDSEDLENPLRWISPAPRGKLYDPLIKSLKLRKNVSLVAVPVRCFTCNKPINQLTRYYLIARRRECLLQMTDNPDMTHVLEKELNLERYCCRMRLSQAAKIAWADRVLDAIPSIVPVQP